MRGAHLAGLMALALGGCDAASEAVVARAESTPDAGRVDAGAPPPRDGGRASPPDAGERDATVGLDLELTDVDAPPISLPTGFGFDLDFAVTAGGAAGVAAPSAVRFTLEAAGAPPVELGVAVIPALGASGRYAATAGLWIPPRTPARRYRVVATVDPDENLAEADETNNRRIAGQTWVSAVVVTPGALTFGTVGLGCTRTATVELWNRGGALTFVTEQRVPAGGDFEVLARSPPYGLPSGVRRAIPVRFTARGAQDRSGTLRIVHDGIAGPVDIPLLAAGADRPWRRATFEAGVGPRLDLLVVVDGDPGMIEERPALWGDAGRLVQGLRDANADVHLGVTSMDAQGAGPRGRLLGRTPWTTARAPSAGHAFAESLRVASDGRAALPQGLEAARLALASATNPGFRRVDAALAVVFATDRDDASPDPVAAYRDDLEAAAGPPGLRLAALVDPEDRPCPAGRGPAPRLAGVLGPEDPALGRVCAVDWADLLEALLADGFGRRAEVELSDAPLPGSVEVRVNGLRLTPDEDWRLVGERTVRFSEAARPSFGSTVDVRFRTRC